jgi:type II secretory ATPase GspE/PulE/Tfp pilus assembly ATPase PilB-like protein
VVAQRLARTLCKACKVAVPASAEQVEELRQDLERLQNLISLYERASPLVPEDMEVIRQYRNFINYDQIRQSVDELVTTIRGGADWAEQLTDLLKQFSVGDLAKLK